MSETAIASKSNPNGYSPTRGPSKEVPELNCPLPPFSITIPKEDPTRHLEKFAKTPDKWVKRDERMVLLTGLHPYNVEPPLNVLHNLGPLTTPALHYVRNHGAPPNLSWHSHTVTVACGDKETVFDMNQILQMKAFTQPVTLVCAGNRRKEENQVMQTIGFNWGAAGCGTSLWSGPLLSEVLRAAGISEEDTWNYHCEMIGYEDLPNKVGPGPYNWPKKVKYGTSIPMNRVWNDAYSVQLSYAQNLTALMPDHGFPIRVIIPGYIGGRMIKWLSKINIIPNESTNHYHFHDNRVLPPEVTSYEQSLAEKWWYKPEYIFNELNINSAIAYPHHDDEIDLPSNLTNNFNVQGYAYAGGGNPISRVEVSLDEGATWICADINRPFPPNHHGMHWCWIFWSLPVSVARLSASKSIICRAWDNHTNTQPLSITWNLMGMANNCCFRVKIHSFVDQSGRPKLKFEHPTLAGAQKGGWMTKDSGKPVTAGFGNLRKFLEDQEAAELAAEAKESKGLSRVMSNPNGAFIQGIDKSDGGGPKGFTMADIAKHDTEHDCWIVVHGKVYDCTQYMDLHPGGADSIVILGGQDASEDFDAIHSKKAHKMLERFYIGDLVPDIDVLNPENTTTIVDKVEYALNPKKKLSFALKSKEQLSHDSFLLTFALQTPETILGLPTGKHIFLSAYIQDELTPGSKKSLVMRRYTPITSNFDVGVVKFVIKSYPPCERFPRGGKMSQHLASLQVGETIDMRGPVGEFEYSECGNFKINDTAHHVKRFNMVAGGTGITPCYQVVDEILRNPNDETHISLIFACNDVNDLLCKATLDRWQEEHPDRFKVTYILASPTDSSWTGPTGFVTLELFQEQFYDAAPDTFILMCGPPIMLERACYPSFSKLGYDEEKMFGF